MKNYHATGMNYDDVACLIGWVHSLNKVGHFLTPMAVEICNTAIQNLSNGLDIFPQIKSAKLMLSDGPQIFKDFIKELSDIQNAIH